MVTRTTIMLDDRLYDRVLAHIKEDKTETMSEFTKRAFLNQLEREGDFEIRDILEDLEDEEDTI